MRIKRVVIVSGLTLLLAATTLTVAFAAPGGEAGPNHQAFIQKVAEKLGITPERLTTAMKEARTELGIAEGKGGFKGGVRGPKADFTAAADAIGITMEQLKQELPGRSLAQVAQAHGKNPADVATALKNAANKRIDDAVANGRLTADQAVQAKQRAAEHIDEHMNQVMPQPGERRQGQRGPGRQAPAA